MNSNDWNTIKKKLRVRINPVLVKIWVDPLSARYENGVVQLIAPNEFVMNWVRKHLLDRIRDAAQEVLSAKVGITIDLDANSVPAADREYVTDVHAYYAAEDILASINRMTGILRESSFSAEPSSPGSPKARTEQVHPIEPQSFDSILDAVLEAFGVSFREMMTQENEHSMLARRALYYLCIRYGISAEEVALNMDCTVSEVRMGATELENEISNAIDNGEDLDELLLRIFKK
ncbi:DnaA N-terminal domain-containing protein [Maridesulfovibrio sp. FT414]|uniref:DnaA N-terminal domain-containing protein n=1 Tax=Maridesulfovibrio sp. FT414 TaxID=2979469 RepID=UPI003D80740F